jgi:uncharacterized protein (TIGR04222 family)
MTLLDNPIGNLSSAQFLSFYATLCVATVVCAVILVRMADSSDAQGAEPVPRDLDPYEIAYLRGDINELVRFLVFDLVRSGALEIVPSEKKKPPIIQRCPTQLPAVLSQEAEVVYDYFAEPHTAAELFGSATPGLVEAMYAAKRQGLETRLLFRSDASVSAASLARIGGTIVIFGFGGYRLVYASLMHHSNVGFTIFIGVFSFLALLFVTVVPRLSRRGRDYLHRLRAALPATSGVAATASPAFPLVIAASGMAALVGTPYAAMGQTFRQQAAMGNSSGGCGSASSGGSCSGGGCGGGGCGGGGD